MTHRETGSFGLHAVAIDKIHGVLRAHPKVEKAILYGSRAKGTHRPGSDIDLALLGENLTVQELLTIDGELDDLLLPYKIDLCLYGTIESTDLLDHIDRMGMPLYEQIVEDV